MARNLGVFVRNLLPNSKCIQNHTLKTLTLASSYPSTPSSQAKPFSNSLPSPNVNFLQQQRHRRLSSPFSGSRHSRFTNLKSGLQFRRMMFSLRTNNLKDKAPKSLVFFFTAPAADTCTVMYSSVVRELIEQYPNVLGYKIDASKEDFDCAMTTFSVRAVPAVVFVKDKKWVSYVVGVNVALLKCTFETVYGERPTKEEEEEEEVRPKVDVHA
ncbi:unnamed protein product [Malus baccata var. baccata]